MCVSSELRFYFFHSFSLRAYNCLNVHASTLTMRRVYHTSDSSREMGSGISTEGTFFVSNNSIHGLCFLISPHTQQHLSSSIAAPFLRPWPTTPTLHSGGKLLVRDYVEVIISVISLSYPPSRFRLSLVYVQTVRRATTIVGHGDLRWQ